MNTNGKIMSDKQHGITTAIVTIMIEIISAIALGVLAYVIR